MSDSLRPYGGFRLLCEACDTGILQTRILDRVAMSSSRGLPDPGIEPTSLTYPALAGGFFTSSTTWESLVPFTCCHILSKACLRTLMSLFSKLQNV